MAIHSSVRLNPVFCEKRIPVHVLDVPALGLAACIEQATSRLLDPFSSALAESGATPYVALRCKDGTAALGRTPSEFVFSYSSEYPMWCPVPTGPPEWDRFVASDPARFMQVVSFCNSERVRESGINVPVIMFRGECLHTGGVQAFLGDKTLPADVSPIDATKALIARLDELDPGRAKALGITPETAFVHRVDADNGAPLIAVISADNLYRPIIQEQRGVYIRNAKDFVVESSAPALGGPSR